MRYSHSVRCLTIILKWAEPTLDGGSLRGTIPAGELQGLHLLAAFLPEEGWVLMQMEGGDREREVTVPPRLLQALDLRGKVVTGDALLAQRSLRAKTVEAGASMCGQ